MKLFDIIKSKAYPDGLYFINEDGIFTRDDFVVSYNKIYEILNVSNTTVALIQEDNYLSIVACLILWERNNCVVLINGEMPESVIVKQIEDSRAVYTVRTSKGGSLHPILNPIEHFDYYEKNEILVLYSSGTTNIPKGIVLGKRQIEEMVELVYENMSLNDHDVLYISRRFTTASAFIGELLVCIRAGIGCCIYKSQRISRTALFSRFSINKVSIWCTNQPLLNILIRSEKQSNILEIPKYLRKIYISGSVVNVDRLIQQKAYFRQVEIINLYGMTEAGLRIAGEQRDSEIGSVGKPFSGICVRVVDPKLKDVAKGIKGEILVKSPYCMKRYTNAQAPFITIDDEKWLKTNDVGYWGVNGDLYVCGRNDDTVVVNGNNINLTTVENVILSTINELLDCTVLPHQDKAGIDFLICYYKAADEISSMEFREKLSEQLAEYEIPKLYFLTQQLPMTASGKKRRENISD